MACSGPGGMTCKVSKRVCSPACSTRRATGSAAGSQYRSDDAAPQKGLNYYRLKQVDLNGDFHLSEIRSINNSHQVNQVKIYPNPTDKGLVTIISDEPISDLFIYNALGKVVFEAKIDSDDTYLLDTQSFDTGMYWNSLNGENYKLIVH